MYSSVQRVILGIAMFLVISGLCVIVDTEDSVDSIPQEEFVNTIGAKVTGLPRQPSEINLIRGRVREQRGERITNSCLHA